jgi:hypothetical protein
MKRRTLLLGIGTTAGTGSIVGSGAFTSVSAERNVSVAVANDPDAFLSLGPCDGPNGDYVTVEGGVASIDLSPSNTQVSGNGVNNDAVSVFDDVFEIANQGTQPVGVWIDAEPATDRNGDPVVEFYRNGDRSTEIIGQGNAVCLDVGEDICVGLRTDTRSERFDPGDRLLNIVSGDHELIVNADATVACGAGPPTGGGPLRLSTGVADWEVVEVPPSATDDAPSTPYDAKVVDPPSAWATSETDAEWVDPFGTGGLQNDPYDADDPYAYELNVPASGTLVIEEYGSDNPVEFFLNGSSIGGSGGQNAFDSFRSDVSDQSVSSGDTLRAEVINESGSSGNPTGLLVAARLE